MHMNRKIGLHTENNVSSPPLGGSPTPLRVRWWWCCFHCPLQPMLGTWWQRCQKRGMGLGFSKLGWNIKTPRTSVRIIQKKPATTGTNGNAQKIQNHPGILQVGRRRWVSPIGNPVIVRRRTCKTGSFRDACGNFWEDYSDGCNVRKWQRRQSACLPVGSAHGSQWSCEAGQRRQTAARVSSHPDITM